MIEMLLQSPAVQIALLVCGIVVIALLASFVTFNFRKSLSFLISADTFAGSTEELDRKGFSTGLILTITGMLIFGGLISVLNNAFVKQLEESRLTKVHAKLNGAFSLPSYSGNALRFLERHGLRSYSRGYTIEDLEYELEVSRADIVDSIALLQGFRIRQVFSPKLYIAVEKLMSNRSFGTLTDRSSAATMLATGPLDCRYVGQFSYVLADNADANYLSNDFFNRGHLDESRRRSFTIHEANQTFESPDHSDHQAFFDALSALDAQTGLYVYAGCNHKEEIDLEISCAGSRQPETTAGVCEGIPNFQEHFSRLEAAATDLDFKVVLDLDEMNEEHIAVNTHRRFGKPVLNLYPSIHYLGMESELRYYQLMKAVLDFVGAVDDEVNGE